MVPGSSLPLDLSFNMVDFYVHSAVREINTCVNYHHRGTSGRWCFRVLRTLPPAGAPYLTQLGPDRLKMMLSVSYGWESVCLAPRVCVGTSLVTSGFICNVLLSDEISLLNYI